MGTPRPKRVVMSGWYGMGNLGDEVILQSIVYQLRRRLGEVSVTVLSERPYNLKSEYGVNSLRASRRRIDLLRKILAMNRADLFVLGGGGILMDYGKRDNNVSRWLEDMALAQRLHVPNMAWGVGVGRIWTENSKRWIRDVLPRSGHVFVRDNGSAVGLSALGVREGVVVTCDPALLLPDLDGFRKLHEGRNAPGKKPKILVSLRHWHVTGDWTFDNEVFSKAMGSLAALLSHLIKTYGASVTFVPFRTETEEDDDRLVEGQVSSGLGVNALVRVMDHVPTSREFMQLAADSDLVIGMRLHSLIMATAVGVPCIALSYDDKVKGYMESLGVEAWALRMEEANYERLLLMAVEALEGRYPTEKVKEMIGVRRASAEADIEKAAELVGTGGSMKVRFRRLGAAVLASTNVVIARKGVTLRPRGKSDETDEDPESASATLAVPKPSVSG
jgi:polysaccharide pyruvyl transferase CsaB